MDKGYNSCKIELINSTKSTAELCPVGADIMAGQMDPGWSCISIDCNAGHGVFNIKVEDIDYILIKTKL